MKMKVAAAILLLVSYELTTVGGNGCCNQCQYAHPQEIVCNSDFVGLVEVIDIDRNGGKSRNTTANRVAAKMRIVKIYKDENQNHEDNAVVDLYEPEDQSCQREYWKGIFLISGQYEKNGLLSTRCDLREVKSHFQESQLKAIESNIESGTYERGCSACTIKEQYDFTPMRPNECRQFYKFPIATTPCILNKNNGRCRWADKSRQSGSPSSRIDGNSENTFRKSVEIVCLRNTQRDEVKIPNSPPSEFDETTTTATTATAKNNLSFRIKPTKELPKKRIIVDWSNWLRRKYPKLFPNTK